MPGPTTTPTTWERLEKRRPQVVLFLAGCNLILLQFFIIRELNALLQGTELVYLLTTLAYFAGFSVGYGLAGRLTGQLVAGWAWITWGLHLTLPFGLRYVGGATLAWVPGLGFLLVLFLLAFALAAFYSLLLPHLIDAESDERLVPYYAAELCGAGFGVLLVLVVGAWPTVPPVIYQLVLAALLVLVLRRTWVLAPAVVGLGLYLWLAPILATHSLDFTYRTARGMQHSEPHVELSVNSPYQKVEVVRTLDGEPSLFLDGLRYYGTAELARFNTFLAELPARLRQPESVLIVGSGSLESVARVAPHSGRITTVEIDPVVAAASRRFFGEVNHLASIEDWTLVIDDAKHHLGEDPTRYDLIVLDVPAPFTIQTGLLYGAEFFDLALDRLNPGGLLTVTLCEPIFSPGRLSRTVLAGLLAAEAKLVAVTPRSAGQSFVYAARDLDLRETRQAAARLAAELEGAPVKTHSHGELAAMVRGATPIRRTDLTFPVGQSWARIRGRYLGGGR